MFFVLVTVEPVFFASALNYSFEPRTGYAAQLGENFHEQRESRSSAVPEGKNAGNGFTASLQSYSNVNRREYRPSAVGMPVPVRGLRKHDVYSS